MANTKTIEKLHKTFPSIFQLKGKAPNLKNWQTWCFKPYPFYIGQFEDDTQNAGLPCGPANNCLVGDDDQPDAIRHYVEKHGEELKPTRTHITGKGGIHYFWKFPEECEEGFYYGNASVKDDNRESLFDIRGIGGQVVAPGSIHPETGEYYTIGNDIPMAQAPQCILDLCKRPIATASPLLQALFHGYGHHADQAPQAPGKKDEGLHIPVGDPDDILQNLQLSYSVKHLIKNGTDKGERSEAIFSVITSLLNADVEDSAIHLLFGAFPIGEKFRENGNFTARLQAEIDRARAKEIPENFEDFLSFRRNTTDTGNAERLVKLHGRDIRFCPPQGKWYVFDGRHWKVDDLKTLNRIAKHTVKDIYKDASKENSEKTRKTLSKWAMKSDSRSKIEAMIYLAQGEEGIPILPADMDTHKFLLNVNNGTLNLETGDLLVHDRRHLITKIIPINYDPQAQCPRWLQFLDEITDSNADLVEYMQKAIGYSLTGDTREDCFFILHGNGANGKSTFLQTVSDLLDDYSLTADFTTFLQTKIDKIRNDIAGFYRKRLVMSIEAPKNKQFAEQILKALTGRDTISARFLFKEYFQFKPECKIFMAVNDLPKIEGTDYAIWRRVRLIPFDVRFPDEDQDKTLPDTLKKELPGILTWSVEGCKKWLKDGLESPKLVKSATDKYRADMDIIGPFLSDCCVVYPDNLEFYEKTADLYSVYKAHTKREGDIPISLKSFGDRLRKHGLTDTLIGKRRLAGWKGITITTEGWHLLKSSEKEPQGADNVPF